MKKQNAFPQDDKSCGWYHLGPHRQPTKPHQGRNQFRWAVVGAGFTGLAAARQLAEHFPDDEVALIEAQEIGFGSSGRNSGFAIDLPHDISAKDYIGDIETARMVLKLNLYGQSILKSLVEKYKIDCDMQYSGKYQAAIEKRGLFILESYKRGLDKLQQPYEMIEAKDLPVHIGTNFYKKALFTPGTILVQPSALVKGLADNLPKNISLYENTPILGIETGKKITLLHKNGQILCENLILANNGSAMNLGFLKSRMLPVFLYASLSRALTDAEQSRLGGKASWGIIPADPFGSTLRKTQDNRILVRNNFTFNPTGKGNPAALQRLIKHHKRSFEWRFPMLPDVDFEYSWSGGAALAQNHEGFFGALAPNIYGALCCNGLGVTRGTVNGTLLADWIAGKKNKMIEFLLAAKGPNKLPPEPFLSLGVRASFAWRQHQAGKES